jgi:hypothetical protein
MLVCLPASLPVHPSVCLPVYLFVYLSVSRSVYLSACQSICPSVSLSDPLSLSLSLSLSFCLLSYPLAIETKTLDLSLRGHTLHEAFRLDRKTVNCANDNCRFLLFQARSSRCQCYKKFFFADGRPKKL